MSRARNRSNDSGNSVFPPILLNSRLWLGSAQFSGLHLCECGRLPRYAVTRLWQRSARRAAGAHAGDLLSSAEVHAAPDRGVETRNVVRGDTCAAAVHEQGATASTRIPRRTQALERNWRFVIKKFQPPMDADKTSSKYVASRR